MAFIGDGEHEIIKPLFPFNLLFDICLIFDLVRIANRLQLLIARASSTWAKNARIVEVA